MERERLKGDTVSRREMNRVDNPPYSVSNYSTLRRRMSTFSLTFPYSRQRTRNSTGVYSVSQTLLVGKIRFAAIKIELVTIPVDVALPSHMSALPPPPMSPSCPRPSDNFPSSSFDLQNRNFSPQLWNSLVSAFDPNFLS